MPTITRKPSAVHLPVSTVSPPLDPAFRPAVLADRAFREEARVGGRATPLELGLEQPGGAHFVHETVILPEDTEENRRANLTHVERLAKFLLWSCGGSRLKVRGSRTVGEGLADHYRGSATGQFDDAVVARKIYGEPLKVEAVAQMPPARTRDRPLGRYLDGCRIGFDLGGSDRKVAAVVDGEVVFSEEVPWDPYYQPDPEYHRAGILDSLRRAAEHLPRVDAVGGSAAGVYVDNRVRVGSLFRGVSEELFETRVRDLFVEIRRELGGVPFVVLNDGEVTALAGFMALMAREGAADPGGVLGIALGTSTAAGFVNAIGRVTPRLNELAFAPIDAAPGAPRDEWSGDAGCAVQYLSQQAVGRLVGPAGIEVEAGLPLPEVLVRIQERMAAGDERAERIYQTVGVYLGYALAHYDAFYDFRHVLLLGRVTSGPGGEVLRRQARRVLDEEFPEMSERIALSEPGERDKRHGQAIAAASLPNLSKRPRP